MSAWTELVTAALIGTERQAKIPEAGLLKLQALDPESKVLGQAAALGLQRRAGGQVETTARTPLPSSPPEERPAVDEHAARRLGQILVAHPTLLPEWLLLAARTGRRAPHGALPALLDAGRQSRALRPLVLPLLGGRGAWLAQHNRDWSWALGAEDEGETAEIWQTAGREARALALRRERERDPRAALALLSSTWASEPPDDRAAFMAALSVNLSQADEDFLEAALDDRRREVRAQAADLLAQLPQSRLARRMHSRLAPLLQLERGHLLKRSVLRVELPGECDKSMVRDGLNPKFSGGTGVGERAWWLQQLVGRTHPDFWTHRWDLTEARIVELARASEWAGPLLNGFAESAARCAHARWADALLQERDTFDEQYRLLVAALPEERREALALRQLRYTGKHLPPGVALILHASTHPWSAELTRALLARLRALMHQAPDSARWPWQGLLTHAALHAPPELADEIQAAWPTQAPHWEAYQHLAEQFTATLHLRHTIHKELSS
ncbi:DUF5691 domain-containing protein [Deinococcus peraridilitoris]|uniref:Uncharacterized protein n=1 Tax=Deinococcus peraridilitoris (strain DSM 19664 / LMG 22246 / CIP 109416 / KR-200) TaxID=937777 RepID=L0A3H2_DEIPD|nr:DUF5691 domain-containing protein [Deinococcus peraridilitoris]AFZ67722.1 hypothetical protein Deipe_2238 [Deinococcus peraridilitoris DSM 19664]